MSRKAPYRSPIPLRSGYIEVLRRRTLYRSGHWSTPFRFKKPLEHGEVGLISHCEAR